MSPLMLLLTTITVGVVGAVITSVTRTTRNDNRNNAMWEALWQGKDLAAMSVRAPVSNGKRRSQTAPSTSAAADKRGTTDPPTADLPPLGAHIRLNDGRTGTVAATERVEQATRVHLELDGGGRGHVDVPDRVRPAASPQKRLPGPRSAPAVSVQPQANAVPATAMPAVAKPAPAPAPAKAAAPNPTVRLGGFSVPVTPGRDRS